MVDVLLKRHAPMCLLLKNKKESGFTLAEVLIGSLVFAALSWGIISSYVAVSRLMRRLDAADYIEATNYATQTMERFRNMIACDPAPTNVAEWFDSDCQPTGALTALSVWTDDPLPLSAGTDSILNQGSGARRIYCVKLSDCNGAAAVGDCLEMRVQVCWDNILTCTTDLGSAC